MRLLFGRSVCGMGVQITMYWAALSLIPRQDARLVHVNATTVGVVKVVHVANLARVHVHVSGAVGYVLMVGERPIKNVMQAVSV